jgi:adenylate cyclase class 2
LKTRIEIEIKLRIESVAKARALLRRNGFAISALRVFEQNLVLDNEQGALRENGMLLRLRSAGHIFTCTFKGPVTTTRLKSREEIEFRAGDFESCIALFEALGFREAFRYEKYRTEFAREGEPGHVTLDETPIGVFMELEGPAGWIARTAKTLGFPPSVWITDSYSKLYDEWCQANGIAPKDMRFSRRQ